MFSKEALEKGIEDIKKNILIFEDTIDKERQRIKEYRDMIDVIERKERESNIIRNIEINPNGD
jgi:hypothetical protein